MNGILTNPKNIRDDAVANHVAHLVAQQLGGSRLGIGWEVAQVLWQSGLLRSYDADKEAAEHRLQNQRAGLAEIDGVKMTLAQYGAAAKQASKSTLEAEIERAKEAVEALAAYRDDVVVHTEETKNRLTHKMAGVRLVQSYLEESLRILSNARPIGEYEPKR